MFNSADRVQRRTRVLFEQRVLFFLLPCSPGRSAFSPGTAGRAANRLLLFEDSCSIPRTYDSL
jgi:hypothetical protein